MRHSFIDHPHRVRRHAAIVTLVCALAPLGACNKIDFHSPADHIDAARKALDQGKPREAEIELKTALQKEPKNVSGRLLLAQTYLALRQGQNAEVELAHAEQFGATSDMTLLPRARAYLVQHNYARVLKDLPPATLGAPAHRAEVAQVRGEAQAALGLPKEAEASFDTVLSLTPDSIAGLEGKARAVAVQGRSDEALSLIDTTILKNPGNTSTLLLKGDVLQSLNRTDEALPVYREAVKGAPNNQDALLKLTSALVTAKQFGPAKEQLDAVLKKWPKDPRGQYLLAIIRYQGKDLPGALDAVQMVTAADPNFGPGIILTASIQYSLGNYPSAENNAQRFVAGNPRSIYGRKLLAVILLREQKVGPAYEIIKPLLDDPSIQDPQVFAVAGSALAAVGDPRAHGLLLKAVQLDPNNGSLRNAVGLDSLNTGNTEGAISAFTSLTQIDPQSADAASFLALSFAGRRDFAAALKVVNEALAKRPNSPQLYNILGGVYLAKQDLPNARQSFEKATALNPDWAPPVLNLAKLDLAAKHPEDARKRLADVAGRGRTDAGILSALAGIDQSQGRRADAQKWLERAAKENPDSFDTQRQVVDFLLDGNQAQPAVGIAREYATRKPNDPDALLLVARAESAAGQRDAAVATYGRLAGLLPKSALVQVSIARLEAQDGHTAAAQSALSKALSIDPKSIDAKVALAELNMRMGRLDEAARAVKDIEKDPASVPTARLLAGDIASGRRQPDAAIAAYQDAFARLNSSRALIKLHSALFNVGRGKEANDKLATWIEQNPRDLDSRVYLGGFYETQGDAANARKYFLKALEVDPNNPIALNELALIAGAAKDPAALDFAERALSQKPESPQILDTLGWLLVDAGQAPRGKELLERAVAKAPNDFETRLHLASALVKVGDKDAARAQLRTVMKSSADGTSKAKAQKILNEIS